MFKKVLSLTIAAVITISSTPLSDISKVYAQENDVKVWLPTNVEKIRQDQAIKSIDNGKALSISLARNESEGGQFILRNDVADMQQVQVSLTDLKTANGNILSKDDVSVYEQYYVNVTQTTNSSIPQGMYPDALIPLSANKSVTKGQNQGWWLTVNAKENQPAGEYTGEITVSYTGGSLKIPMQVKIWNFAIPTASSFDRALAIWPGQLADFYGKTDTSSKEYWDLQKQFYNFQLSYRATPTDLPILCDEDHIDSYVAEAKAMIENDDRITCYRIPFFYKKVNGSYDFEKDKNKELVDKLNAAGILSKGYYYVGGLIDEPTPSMFPLVKQVCSVIKEIAPGVRNVVTTEPKDELDGYINTWSPIFHAFEEGMVEEQKAKGAGVWWYGCVSPKNPYPTYHIDDRMMSARALNWMQKDYGVQGDLYWCTDIFKKYNTSAGQYEQRDVFNDPMAFPGAAGDGYLMYPGKANDGIINANVPVPTIRLEAIRDGAEDYEYLCLLEKAINQKINKLGLTDTVSAHDVLNYYYDQLYVAINDFDTDPQKMLELRKMIANEIVNADSINYLMVAKTPQASSMSREITIYAPKDSQVSCNGQAVTGAAANANTDKFTTTIAFKAGRTDVPMSVSKDGVTQDGGKFFIVREPAATRFETNLLNFESFSDDVSTILNNENSSVKSISADATYTTSGSNGLKIEFDATKDKSQIDIPAACFDSPAYDFTKYDTIEFDMFVPVESKAPVNLYIGLKDAKYTDISATSGAVTSGSYKKVSIPISSLKANPLGWKNVTDLIIGTNGVAYQNASGGATSFAVFLDNFKLVASKDPYCVKQLADFESDAAMAGIKNVDTTTKISADWASTGAHSLQIDMDNYWSWPGVEIFPTAFDNKVIDWSRYKYYTMDVNNPGDKERKFFIKVTDNKGNQDSYSDIVVAPHSTYKVKLDLDGVKSRSPKLDLHNIAKVQFLTWASDKYTVYVDNIQLQSYSEILDDVLLPEEHETGKSSQVKALTLDGKLDEAAWFESTQIKKVMAADKATIASEFGTLWDSEYMYVGVQVTDPSGLRKDFTKDTLSLYVSPQSYRNSPYSAKDFQLQISNQGKTVEPGAAGMGNNDKIDTSKVKVSAVYTDKGYTMEIAIPWSVVGTTPQIGNKIGLDLMVFDSDDPGSILVWSGDGDDWKSTKKFGEVTLQGENTNQQSLVYKTNDVTFDGLLNESLWSSQNDMGIVLDASKKTIDGKFGMLWDENYMYIGVKVTDPSGIRKDFSKDTVTFYVSPKNYRGNPYSADDFQIQIFNVGGNLTVEKGTSGMGNNDKINLSNIKTKCNCTSQGYTMEIAIPWTEMKVAPQEDTKIGFDIMAFDSDDPGCVLVWSGDGNDWTSTMKYGTVKLAKDSTLLGVELDKDSLTVETTDSTKLNATITAQNLPDKTIVWSSSDKNIATVDQQGNVTGIAAGNAVITASVGGYKANCPVTVVRKLYKKALASFETESVLGGLKQVGSTIQISDAWASAGTHSMQLNNDTYWEYPGAEIYVESFDKQIIDWSKYDYFTMDIHNPSSKERKFFLKTGDDSKHLDTYQGITVPANSTYTVKLDLQELKKRIPDFNLQYVKKIQLLSWATEKYTVYVDNLQLLSYTEVLKDTVLNPDVTDVTLSEHEITLQAGDSKQLSATVLPDNAVNRTVTWTSSNESIATVDANGNVKAVGTGSAKITATAGGISDICQVTVTKPISGISLDQTKLSLKKNGSTQLNVTITPADTTDSKAVTWTSSNESVATVNNGKVAAVGVGSAEIKAKVGNYTATCVVTVTEDSVSSNPSSQPGNESSTPSSSSQPGNASSTTSTPSSTPASDEPVLNDSVTGITVRGNALPSSIRLAVMRVQGSELQNAQNAVGANISQATVRDLFDISLLNSENVKVQPDGTVTVTIPISAELLGQNLVVYYMDGDTPVAMPTKIENGVVSFTTTHFSRYALVEIAAGTSNQTENTSDSCTAIVILIGILLASGLCSVILVKKRNSLQK